MEFTSSEPAADPTSQGLDQAFIAFARIFSGKVQRGQKVYVLGPKHDPAKVRFSCLKELLTLNAFLCFLKYHKAEVYFSFLELQNSLLIIKIGCKAYMAIIEGTSLSKEYNFKQEMHERYFNASPV